MSALNLYAKGTYELGNVYMASEGVEKGGYRRSWNIQLCAEYYPMSGCDFIVYLLLYHNKVHFTEKDRKWGLMIIICSEYHWDWYILYLFSD